MRKQLKRVGICLVFAAAVWLFMLVTDRQTLKRELIRLHVVAASDSPEDQAVKLQVRDAILENLQEGLSQVTDVSAAISYVESHLPAIEETANRVLELAGAPDSVRVSLDLESFPKRIYDTFSLPSGIYQSLRVMIGEGEGQNWWCVIFPELCLPETEEAFSKQAEESGLGDTLTQTLQEKDVYCIRFFFLDLIGKVENLLFSRK
ncbi:MAG: stage II sporulation protein R [Firmicutes bacterium]|nr:stage II sporulation protein R [Bacillota bacterium]